MISSANDKKGPETGCCSATISTARYPVRVKLYGATECVRPVPKTFRCFGYTDRQLSDAMQPVPARPYSRTFIPLLYTDIKTDRRHAVRSIVVDHLRKQFGNETGIAAIYCNYKDIEVQTPANLFASLWMQLVESHPISDDVKMLHKKHIDRSTRPSLSEILQVLRSEIDDYSGSKVFIIVDALDECPEDNKIRGTILTELQALQSTVHLMVTSRPHVTVELDPPCLIVDIRASDGDVLHYVDGRISCDQQLARHLKRRAALREDLRKTVVHNAQGMYVDQSV
jgi:hypothetical protein